MTLQEKFSRACSPSRWEILGKRLRPLSVGHVQLFSQLSVEDDISPADLVTAVRACAMTYERAERYLFGGGWSLWALRAMIAMRLRPILFHTAVEMFKAYVAAPRELIPTFFSDSKLSKDSSCPETLMLLRDLRTHYTESQILNMPLAKAHWIRLAEVEKGGGIDFIEDDILEQARAMALEAAQEAANA
jgi:hypothetical protein